MANHLLQMSGIDSVIQRMSVGANIEIFGNNLFVFRALESDDIAPI